jgi:hypothetical protein
MGQLPLTFQPPRPTHERRKATAEVAKTLRLWADVANRNDQGYTGTTLTIAARMVSDDRVGEAWALLRMSARVAGIIRKHLRGPAYTIESVTYRQRAYLAAARYVGTTLGHGKVKGEACGPLEWEADEDGMRYACSVENSFHRGITDGSSVRVEEGLHRGNWRYAVEVYIGFPTWARDGFQWRETCETLEAAKASAREWAAWSQVVLSAACAAWSV